MMQAIIKAVVEVLAGMLLKFLELEARVAKRRGEIDEAKESHEKVIEESEKLTPEERKARLIESGRSFIDT